MQSPKDSIARLAAEVAPRARPTGYPAPFAKLMAGREKRALGDAFGLTNYGVNLTRIVPGAASSLRHAHSRQDEFVYVLSGHPTLITDEGERLLSPGMCAGFKAGSGNSHHLVNRSDEPAAYLEIGDRTIGDAVAYPDDDIQAMMSADGHWRFTHKDGTPY